MPLQPGRLCGSASLIMDHITPVSDSVVVARISLTLYFYYLDFVVSGQLHMNKFLDFDEQYRCTFLHH